MKTIASIFWNRAERRIRTTWRLIAQLLLMGLLLPILQASAAILLSVSPLRSVLSGTNWTSAILVLTAIVASGLAVSASIIISARVFDKRRFADLGFNLSPSWWADFSFGLGLGALLLLLLFLAELSLGWIEIQGIGSTPPGSPPLLPELIISLLLYCAVGFYEELLSRGYLIKNLSEGLSGTWITPRAAILLACLLSSVFFGLLHAANPNSTPLAVANIILAGILLASGYLITGQLALSIGLHISWNFFQGPVFGFPVSGSQLLDGSVFKIQQLGPALWTGSEFGPEGGLLGTLASLLGLLLILLWKRGKGRIQLDLSRYGQEEKITGQSSLPVSGVDDLRQIKHIIWDWNGTLLDDLDLCLQIINDMLAARNLPSLSRKIYQHVFDFPVKSYYQKIGFDFSQEDFESISDEFIKAYEKGRPACSLMDGAREILAYSASLGLSQSILSASKGSYLLKAVEEYQIGEFFSAVLGLDNHHAAGKLDLAKEFMGSCDLAPGELLLVGDTTHDGFIAGELGINCVLIPNGHHNRYRLESSNFPVASSLLDIKDIL